MLILNFVGIRVSSHQLYIYTKVLVHFSSGLASFRSPVRFSEFLLSRKRTTVAQSARGHSKTLGNAQRRSKTFEDDRKWSKDARRCSKTLKDARPEMLEDARRRSNFFENNQSCSKTIENARQMFEDAWKRWKTLTHVGKRLFQEALRERCFCNIAFCITPLFYPYTPCMDMHGFIYIYT